PPADGRRHRQPYRRPRARPVRSARALRQALGRPPAHRDQDRDGGGKREPGGEERDVRVFGRYSAARSNISEIREFVAWARARPRGFAPAPLRRCLLEFVSFGAHSSPVSTEALPCLSQGQFPRARPSFVPTAEHFIRSPIRGFPRAKATPQNASFACRSWTGGIRRKLRSTSLSSGLKMLDRVKREYHPTQFSRSFHGACEATPPARRPR